MHGCRWLMPDGTWAICYAEDLAENGVARNAYPQGFAHHYWRPDALKLLTAGKDPRLIFSDSMSDLFAPNVPHEHIVAVLEAMSNAPHHTFQTLTKAAPQLLKFTDRMPPNLWVGISSPPDHFMGHPLSQEQQEAMLRRSIAVLWEVKRRTGNIAWASCEPVSWDLVSVIDEQHAFDWIVIGAASSGRRYFQPDPDHIRGLLSVMDATATPVFFKGNIRAMFESNDLGSKDLNRWREDFPISYRNGDPIPAVTRRQEQCRLHGWTISSSFAPKAIANGSR
jgi:protein gp37